MVHAVWSGSAFLQFFALCLSALQVLLMALETLEADSGATAGATCRDLPESA